MSVLMYDLCCGGGGVARVALSLGWRVVGVDHEPQPEYRGNGTTRNVQEIAESGSSLGVYSIYLDMV